MGPPKYGDLGKQASDVFGKGYHFGLLKLEVTIATACQKKSYHSSPPTNIAGEDQDGHWSRVHLRWIFQH